MKKIKATTPITILLATILFVVSGCGTSSSTSSQQTSSSLTSSTSVSSNSISDSSEKVTGSSAPISEKYKDCGDIEGLITPGTLTVVTDDTQAPLAYRDEDSNQLIGFEVDVMDAIGKYLGLNVQWETTTFDGLIAGVTAKQYDVAAAGIYITDTRKQQVNFTDVYYTMDEVICVPEGNTTINKPEDLAGHTIGVQSGSVASDDVRAIEGVNDSDVHEYSHVPDGLQDMENGRIDAFVTESLMAAYYGKNLEVRYDNPLESIDTAPLVDKSSTQVLAALNEAIQVLKSDGTLGEISQKWFNRDIIKY